MSRLLAAFAVAVALSLPFTNVPVIDDWAYAYSVDQLLQTGRFAILDYSCRYNLAQVAWGALFSLPVGMSFVALRLSTVALVILGLLAFHDLLRRRTGESSLALWATAVLAFNPIFFRLSLSFMTDVPLIALVGIAFWLFDRGVRTESRSLVVAAVVVTVAAYLVRELSLVACGALLLAALVSGRRRSSLSSSASLIAVAVLGFGLEFWWIRAVQGTTPGLELRTEGLRHVLEVTPLLYLRALLQILLTTAACVAPLSLATIGRDRAEWVVIGVGGLAVFAAAVLVGALPFGANEVLSPLGLGMSRALIPGGAVIPAAGEALRVVVALAAGGSLMIVLMELVSFGAHWWKNREPLDAAWILFGIGAAGALLILWLWQDRYDLVLLPSSLWLIALRACRVGWSARAVRLAVAALAIVSVLGTRDDFSLNRAAWQAEAALRGEGVAANEIDGGYALNGWRLYAYSARYSPGFPAEHVPYLFSKESLPFILSTTPLAGTEVVRQYTWMRTWLADPTLYVLHR